MDDSINTNNQLPRSEFQRQLDALRKARTDNTTDTVKRQDVLALAKDVILINGAKYRCIDATLIHELPSAERKGKWVNNIHDMPICNECGYMTPYDRAIDDYEYGNYCPNCGSRNEVNEDAK